MRLDPNAGEAKCDWVREELREEVKAARLIEEDGRIPDLRRMPKATSEALQPGADEWQAAATLIKSVESSS